MSLREVNTRLKKQDFEEERPRFSEASTSGFNFGRSIIAMINSLNMSDNEKDEFIRGLNKILFKEVRIINGEYLPKETDSEDCKIRRRFDF